MSFVSAYEAEAILEYSGIEDINSNPTRNLPPDWSSAKSAEKKEWFYKHFTNIMDMYVMPTKSESNTEGETQAL